MSSFKPHAWINGRFLPLQEAGLSLTDAAVTGGVTVTERLRTFRHELFLREEHLDRLFASATAAHIPIPHRPAELAAVAEEVTARNAAGIAADEDLTVSLFVTAGTAVGPTVCLHAAPLPAARDAESYERGLHLVTPATTAIPASALSPQIKTRSRLHWHIAEAEAKAIVPDANALLLSADGFITETATGNLFCVRNGELLTPARSRTLHGISQRFLFGLAGRLGLSCREADLRLEDLLAAEELFQTGSVSCMLPVVRLNQKPIGDAVPGPVYRRLLAAWSEEVGVDIAGQMIRMAKTVRMATARGRE